MTGFQLATVVLSILGLLLTAGNIILGFAYKAADKRLSAVEELASSAAQECQKLREKVLEEYVKAPHLEAVFKQFTETLKELSVSVNSTRDELHKLNTTVAVLERATLQGKQA